MTAPARIGIALNPTTNDLFLRADGSLAVVNDAEAVGQHLRQRLMTFQGEWFLDTTAGVPWLSDILGKQYNPAVAESVVKAEILRTEGVTSIEAFSVGFNRATRGLVLNEISVRTDYETQVTA